MAKKTKRIALPTDCLAGTDGQCMVVAAHRYCLGRRTYIVGCAIDWLTRHWDAFEANTQYVIVRDTVAALMDNEAGDACDVKGWTWFAQQHFATLPLRDQTRLREELQHKRAPWPLPEEHHYA